MRPRRAIAPQQLKQALRARRDALRRKMAGAKPKKAKKERRRWWLLLALALLLWLLLPDCSEEPEPAIAQELALPAPAAPAPAPPPPPEPVGQLTRRDRPAFESAPQEAPPWIASFRMQVAARSPRLAECFVGVHRPGRLKWTASVEPSHGRVSDHELEPMLQSDALTAQQRDCVLLVLSHPPYRLQVGAQERSTPSRVGMVIEF